MKKLLLYMLLAAMTGTTLAQTVSSPVAFKPGDQYQKEIFTNSETRLCRGSQVLKTNSRCAIYRNYAITDTAGNLYTFTITAKKLKDTLEGMGLQIRYSSDMPTDTKSVIEKDLNNTIGRTTGMVVYKNGLIKSTTATYLPDPNDSLLTLAGLVPDESIQGSFIELIARSPIGGLYREGVSWADSVITTTAKEVINYTIESITDTATIVNFKGIRGKRYDFVQNEVPFKYYLVTNVIGTMSIDNHSGIITTRLTKSATSGRGSISGVFVSVEARRSVWETVKKQ